MGCCDSRPLQEKLLSQKEKVFQFEKVSTPQIKAFFKTNEDSPFLTYSIIIENLKNMGITYTESDELIYIKPFFSLFKKESIKVDCTEEYDIRLLISIMILMSNSRENEKALEIFEIYDIGNNNSFSPYELNFMLKSLLNTIDELKLILNGEKFTKTPMLEKIKNEIVYFKFKSIILFFQLV